MGWMGCHDCWLLRPERGSEGQNGHVSILEKVKVVMLLPPPPSVGALSYSAISQTPPPSPNPPKSHPHHPSIFILPLPQLIDFLFSLFSPLLCLLLRLPPSSPTHFQQFSTSLRGLWLPYANGSQFLLFDKVGAPGRARSCLRLVNGDVM